MRTTLFLARFDIQTAPSPIAIQSGLPGIEIFARIGSCDTGR